MKYLLPHILVVVFLLSSCAGLGSSREQASYHYQMGLSYLGERNMTGALIELTEAEKLTPDDPNVLNALGLAYFNKNKYAIAEQKFLKAISLKPDFSEARNNLGLNYLVMGRWDDAIMQFKLVTDDIFYPDQQTALIHLGRAYFGKGESDKALAVFRSAVANNPSDQRARLDLGRVYFASGKNNLAITEYKRAVELDKDYAKAYYHLGLAYMKIHENESAKSAFMEVVRLAPDLEIGQLSREYLESLK